MMFINKAGLAMLALVSSTASAELHQAETSNPATGARAWETVSSGVSFSMARILPDQARAFYASRGFKLEQIDAYVTSCVYMTVFRNDSAQGVTHFSLDNWSIAYQGQSESPLKTAIWLDQLKQSGANNAALIAFRWAQFPSEHDYQPGGDWNQGMLSTGRVAGDVFDVIARWNIGNNNYQGVLKNVACTK